MKKTIKCIKQYLSKSYTILFYIHCIYCVTNVLQLTDRFLGSLLVIVLKNVNERTSPPKGFEPMTSDPESYALILDQDCAADTYVLQNLLEYCLRCGSD